LKQPIKRSSNGPQNPTVLHLKVNRPQNNLDLCQHECYQSIMFKSLYTWMAAYKSFHFSSFTEFLDFCSSFSPL